MSRAILPATPSDPPLVEEPGLVLVIDDEPLLLPAHSAQ
jgi:hypothetical protein